MCAWWGVEKRRGRGRGETGKDGLMVDAQTKKKKKSLLLFI